MPLCLPSKAPKSTALHNPARIQMRSTLDTRNTSGSGESGHSGLSFARWAWGDDINGLDSVGVGALDCIDVAQLWERSRRD
jgi:hypothetical protein